MTFANEQPSPVRERPILFSAPLVRAILDGRKTQTRRLVKPQPHAGVRHSPFASSGLEDGHGREIRCSHGEPGDQLWARETWAHVYLTDNPEDGHRVEYRADNGNPFPGDWPADESDHPLCGRWKPSIHMRREDSRIQLEVTGVRIERLQDITEADAGAEGCEGARCECLNPTVYGCTDCQGSGMHEPASLEFMHLWDTIYGKREGASWEANPWVWVVEFRRLP